MICCDWCGDMTDSDDQPEGFILYEGKDIFVCERCMEQRHGDDDDEA